MSIKIVGTNWDSANRKIVNDNFKANQEAGGEASKAAKEASKQASNASNKASEAKTQANYAKSQGDYAKDIADSALLNKNTIHDEDTGKTFNWSLKHRDGHMVFAYEEA